MRQSRRVLMKVFFFSCLVSFSMILLAKDMKSFGEDMMFFYTSPTEKEFIQLQDTANEHYQEFGKSEFIVALVIARISEKHNWSIKEGRFSESAKDIISGQSSVSKYVNDDNVVDPQKLDIWWASFFATGEDKYLEKILEYAGEEMPKEDIDGIMVVGAATWSFKSNCEQHKAVRDFAQRLINDGKVKASKLDYLNKCVQSGAVKPT